jgi:pyrimidine-nucleoside phosphorylase
MSAIREAIDVKKRGGELGEGLVRDVVAGYAGGHVPDYQMSALLMAIFIRGMTYDETVALTDAMASSGVRHSFPDCVDKHSTGGIGDKISLCSLPLAAACGAPVAKMSGRGLGVTGGTIDKLEAIPGMTCALGAQRFRRQVAEIGFAIVEAAEAAPADKAVYALRDATGTVDSLPLIGSSIVAKKAATGAGHLLYDVKRGSGAFMTTPETARELAELLVRLSDGLGIGASAIITDMDQPLGSSVGNALEVREAVAFLRGEPVADDLAVLSREVAARLLALRAVADPQRAVEEALSSGAGYEKLLAFVAGQGGDPDAVERGLPVSSETWEVTAPRDGHLARVDAGSIGRAALVLGAGRQRKEDAILFDAGLELHVKVGDRIDEGRPLATVYGRREHERVRALVEAAFELSDAPVPRPELIHDEVGPPT